MLLKELAYREDKLGTPLSWGEINFLYFMEKYCKLCCLGGLKREQPVLALGEGSFGSPKERISGINIRLFIVGSSDSKRNRSFVGVRKVDGSSNSRGDHWGHSEITECDSRVRQGSLGFQLMQFSSPSQVSKAGKSQMF